jgi:hypothetical protein
VELINRTIPKKVQPKLSPSLSKNESIITGNLGNRIFGIEYLFSCKISDIIVGRGKIIRKADIYVK